MEKQWQWNYSFSQYVKAAKVMGYVTNWGIIFFTPLYDTEFPVTFYTWVRHKFYCAIFTVCVLVWLEGGGAYLLF